MNQAEPESHLPYMEVFVRDALGEVAELGADERGAYWSLMFACWAEGGRLANVPRRLARLAGVDLKHWPRVWQGIAALFTVTEEAVTHERVLEQFARASKRRQAKRLGAEKTNAQRFAKRNAEQDAKRSGKRLDERDVDRDDVVAPLASASAPAEKEGADAPRARDPGPGASSPSTTARPAFVPPDESPPDPDRPIETAFDLQFRYRLRWEARHHAMWGGEKGIEVAAREIMERLMEQGPERFARAAALLPRCLDLYLGDSKVAGHRHPFKWFADRLAALMADAETGTTPANRTKEPSLFCDFHRGGANNLVRSPAPVKTCPECRHLGSRARPRPASEPTGFTPPQDPRETWPKAAGGNT